MKLLQLIFGGIFILLTSSCVTNKRLIAIQIAQPSTQGIDVQEAIASEVYEAFSQASSRPVSEVALPDASAFSDSILHLASTRKVSYITIISDTWINREEKKEGYKTLETCTLGFRVRMFDVRRKKMILNSNFDGIGFHESGQYVYPMSEIPYPLYEPPRPSSKSFKRRVPERSAMEKAFDSALGDLRYTLRGLLR